MRMADDSPFFNLIFLSLFPPHTIIHPARSMCVCLRAAAGKLTCWVSLLFPLNTHKFSLNSQLGRCTFVPGGGAALCWVWVATAVSKPSFLLASRTGFSNWVLWFMWLRMTKVFKFITSLYFNKRKIKI